jgi:CRP-like cAMP-binding protein
MKSRTRGNTTDKIDRDLFHQWLWSTRGRGDVVPFTHQEIADLLKCGRSTPSRVIAELIAAGKVRRLRNGKFRVIDPDNMTVSE